MSLFALTSFNFWILSSESEMCLPLLKTLWAFLWHLHMSFFTTFGVKNSPHFSHLSFTYVNMCHLSQNYTSCVKCCVKWNMKLISWSESIFSLLIIKLYITQMIRKSPGSFIVTETQTLVISKLDTASWSLEMNVVYYTHGKTSKTTRLLSLSTNPWTACWSWRNLLCVQPEVCYMSKGSKPWKLPSAQTKAPSREGKPGCINL